MTPDASNPMSLPETQALNTLQIAGLADSASDAQRAEHIRGIVAVTMDRIPADASEATRASTAKWQAWALGVALEMELRATPSEAPA